MNFPITAGVVSQASAVVPPPTEYYFDPAGTDLGTLGSWFTDYSYTTPASELPGPTSSVHLGGLPLGAPSATKFTYGAIELLPSVNCAPGGTPTPTGFTLESASTITGYPGCVLCNLLAADSINLTSAGGGSNFIGCYISTQQLTLTGFTHIDLAGGMGAPGVNGVVAATYAHTNATIETALPGPDGFITDITISFAAASTSLDLVADATINLSCPTTGGDYSGSLTGNSILVSSAYNTWQASVFEAGNGGIQLNGNSYVGIALTSSGGISVEEGWLADCVCAGDTYFTPSTYVSTRGYEVSQMLPNTFGDVYVDGSIHEYFIMDLSSQSMTSEAILVRNAANYELYDRASAFTRVGTLVDAYPLWELNDVLPANLGTWDYGPLPSLSGWIGGGSAPVITTE